MRRILGLTVAFTMALTGTALAHADYRNVTISGGSGTFVDGPNLVSLQCWQATGVTASNTTVYVRGAVDRIHYGFGELSGGWSHIHPANGDYVTGPETRAFFFPGGTSVGTRRVWLRTSVGWVVAIKVVWPGGPADRAAVIRSNC